MPPDRMFWLQPGRLGVNFSHHPAELRDGELSDALNFQIGDRGALEKRRGFAPVGGISETNDAEVLEAAVFRQSTGATWIVAYLTTGDVVASSDGGVTWTDVTTAPLAAGIRPAFAQYLDTLYWSNGTDDVRGWDGATLTSYPTVPKGRYLCVWRNRLWVAGVTSAGLERRVYWSAIGTPTDFTTNPLNLVDFPGGGPITAIATAPNVGGEVGQGDGVLVFSERQAHRIFDDSNNVSGAIVGGANVLIDGSEGCTNHRTVAYVQNRIYLLGLNGIHSTDGHGQLRLESANVLPLFHAMTDPSLCCAAGYRDRYYLAFPTPVAGANDRVLELYADRTVDERGQRAWMPHSMPASVLLVYPRTSGQALYFFDSRDLALGRLRWAFSGFADAAQTDILEDIRCELTTGAYDFGIPQLKSVRRIYLIGRGHFTVSAAGDFEQTLGDSQVISLRRTVRRWDATGDFWGEGVWGAASGLSGDAAYYTTRGRHIIFNISESGQDEGPYMRAVGIQTEQAGGAAVEGLNVTVTPLDSA